MKKNEGDFKPSFLLRKFGEYSCHSGSVVRHALLMAAILASSNSPKNKPLSPPSLSQAFKIAVNIKSFMNLAHAIDELDDTLDTMPNEEIVQLGDTKYGNTPSDFLAGDTISQSSYQSAIDTMISSGILTASVQNTFGNIHSALVKQQAIAAIDYKSSFNIESREKITSIEMGLAQSTVIHVLEHIRGSLSQTKLADQVNLQLSDITRIYPSTSIMSILLEMTDHLCDFIIDIKTEIETGKTSSNWIATKLHQTNNLLDDNNEITPEISEFVRKKYSGFVPVSNQPTIIQKAIQDGENQYYSLANQLPKFQRDLMLSYWVGQKKQGMMTQLRIK